MVAIRTRKYQSNESADLMFSRLDWQVEWTDDFTMNRLSTHPSKSQKPWNGKRDKATGSFSIVKTRRFPKIFLPLIIVDGLIKEDNRAEIELKLRLGPFSLLFYILIYATAILFTSAAVIIGDYADYFVDLLIWIVAFPMLSSIILIAQLDSVQNDIIDLFELDKIYNLPPTTE